MFRFLPREDDYFGLLRELERGVRESTELRPICSAVEIERAIPLVEKNQSVGPNCSEIRRQEEEGDNAYSMAISELFAKKFDALFVIKWQSLYETLEDSIDHCKTVAGLLESI